MSAESKPITEVTADPKLEETKTSNVEESKLAPGTEGQVHTYPYFLKFNSKFPSLESAMKAFGISNPAAQRSAKHEFWNTQPVPAIHEGVYFEILTQYLQI